MDPSPGNTTVPTPSGRRPTPTRGRSPRPPTRSRPTALIPSLKAGRMPHPPREAGRLDPLTQSRPAAPIPPPREAEVPDCFDAEGGIVSSRSRRSTDEPGRGGRTFPIRHTTERHAREFRTRSSSTCSFFIPHLSDRGGSTCPSWQYCDIGCIFSEVPPAPGKIRSIAQHFPRKSPSPPPA